jgi:hypothetical protein
MVNSLNNNPKNLKVLRVKLTLSVHEIFKQSSIVFTMPITLSSIDPEQ